MKKIAILVAVLILGVCAQAQAIVLFQDNFEADTTGTSKNNFINWNVSNGTVDLIGTGTSWNWFPAYGKYVDLDGSTGSAGVLTTKNAITLLAGWTYTLQFDLAGSQRGDANTADVYLTLGTLYAEPFTLAGSAPFQTITRTLTVPMTYNNQYLSFHNRGGDNKGLLLDNVKITGAVPEPMSVVLLGMGLAGLAFRKRKAV